MAPRPRALFSLATVAIGLATAGSACAGRGCGGAGEERAEEAPKPKPKKQGTVADCERYAKTFCELYERCEQRGWERAYGDAKTCREATLAYCAYELRAPGSGDTPKAINECAEAFTKTSCDDWGTRNTPDVCHPPGARKTGEACQISAQCESYYCKIEKSAETCGKCAKLPDEGDSCPDYRCKVGSICFGGRCQKPKKEGDSCSTDFECAATLICFRAKPWAYAGTCAKPLAIGAACPDPAHAYDDEEEEIDEEEAPSSLGSIGRIGAVDAGKTDAKVDALAPDAADAEAGDADAKPPAPTSDCNRRQLDACVAGKCVAQPVLAPGDKCGGAASCRGGYCELGKCQPYRAPGEKCDKSSSTKQCRFPTHCVEGTCRVLDGFECDAPGEKSEKKGGSSLLPFR